MNTVGLNLLIPDKPDTERDALAAAFCRGGGVVYRIGRFWDPPAFDPATRSVIQALPLPRTFVIDVGLVSERGWAVIEFNAAWGAGLNGCDPQLALPSIVAASGMDDLGAFGCDNQK